MMSCPGCGLAVDDLHGHCQTVHKTPLEEFTKPQPVVARVVKDGLTEDKRPSGLSVIREDRGPYL